VVIEAHFPFAKQQRTLGSLRLRKLEAQGVRANFIASFSAIIADAMDKLRAMATFVQIAERRSLTRAARQLSTSVPTVVRTLAALENELGVRLVNRTTRKLALTEEGIAYAEHCRGVLATIAEGERQLSERQSIPRGRVIVTAPSPFGRRYVSPLVARFLAEHRSVSVELWLLDRTVSLTEEGMDIAIRIGHLPDSSLIGIVVGTTRRVVCASPSYLGARGRPKRPEDLSRHDCLRFIGGDRWKEWELGQQSRPQRVTVAGPFDTNHRDSQIELCEAGLGVGQFLEYQVADALNAGRLERVLTRFEPPPLPIHVVYPNGRHASARVRALSAFLIEELRTGLAARVQDRSRR
jgi:DNA-binding transcriptional LysR family regulator